MAEEEKVTEQVLEVSGNGTCVLKDTMGGDQLEKMDVDVKENEETKDVKINGESELCKEKESQSGGKDEVEVMVEEGNDTKEEEQCDKVEEKDGEKIDNGKENIEKPDNEEKNIEKPENEEKKIEKPEDDEKKTEMFEDDKDKTEDVREESEKPEDDKEKIKKPKDDREEIEVTEDKKGKTKKVKEKKPRIEKSEEGSEKLDKPEDGVDKIKKVEDGNEEKESKKRRRVETNVEIKKGKKIEMHEKKAQEPVTPAAPIGRPVRERKSVERLVASIEREPAKELRIGKGRGTALKDIPNVAYKLSRKRTDETFIVLHSILFGRRGKAFNVKSNLSKFSGFVWHENEDKQKLKIKEKFDKFVKEKLLEFCDVLDIHVAKATTRKEDIVSKLVNFLEAPCATTNILLAEKEQTNKGKKRTKAIEKSLPKSGHTTAKRSVRKRRKVDETPSTAKNDPKTEESEDEDGEENNDDISDGTEEMAESSDAEDKKGESEETAKSLKKCSMKDSSSKTKTMKATTPKNSKNLDTTILSSRKTNEDAKTAKKKASTPKNTSEKNKEKMNKKVAEEKPKHKEKSIPTEDEIRDAACEILKKVDFNTATFTDILKKLVKHFGVDLKSRKVAIKEMVQEELAKLAPEEEDDDDEDNEENPDSASQEVEA
ncbi:Dek domain-containing chromatin associated protein [Thalictrum thalictroides]|uniref:Dek domain-containing chromatin associated protein n=1 Tax=Thalictrum thalictroides TaxID=46969 RepID=A0A7J6V005_THATH|nr:Dek domain-containing chromatin associated protein [Thalictrum thalictroides]